MIWTARSVGPAARSRPGHQGIPTRRARANLATALADRFDRDGSPQTSTTPSTSTRTRSADFGPMATAWTSRCTARGCFHDRARLRDDPTDLDRAIACFSEALSSQAPDVGERAGYRNSLGLSLRAKGRATGRPDLLRAADTAFRTAVDEAGPGTPDAVAPTLDLAAVLQDRAEAENDATLLREAVDAYRSELPARPGQTRPRDVERGHRVGRPIPLYPRPTRPRRSGISARRPTRCPNPRRAAWR